MDRVTPIPHSGLFQPARLKELLPWETRLSKLTLRSLSPGTIIRRAAALLGTGPCLSFTFPGRQLKASIWVYDLPQLSTTTYQFATVRVGEEFQYIVTLEMTAGIHNTRTSPKTNITYPLSWTLKFGNGDHLVVKSVLPDQEIYGSKQLADTVYAGYATASGRFFGQKTGFGVVEMIAIFQS